MTNLLSGSKASRLALRLLTDAWCPVKHGSAQMSATRGHPPTNLSTKLKNALLKTTRRPISRFNNVKKPDGIVFKPKALKKATRSRVPRLVLKIKTFHYAKLAFLLPRLKINRISCSVGDR